MSEKIVDEIRMTQTGLKYVITKLGHGKRKPVTGERVKVHYTGSLEDGTVFDTSINPAGSLNPFEFPVGMGRVIKGWDEGIIDMVVGEKRTLTIPHHLAYGQLSQGEIPAYATLIFDVELMEIVE